MKFGFKTHQFLSSQHGLHSIQVFSVTFVYIEEDKPETFYLTFYMNILHESIQRDVFRRNMCLENSLWSSFFERASKSNTLLPQMIFKGTHQFEWSRIAVFRLSIFSGQKPTFLFLFLMRAYYSI